MLTGRRLAVVSLCSVVCLSLVSRAHAAPAHVAAPAGARSSSSIDVSQWLDANSVRMAVSNIGSFGYDMNTGGPGLEYPAGSGKYALYAGGLWLGGLSGPSNDLRVTLAEYSMEFGPGAMLPAGTSDDHAKPEYHVYKLLRNDPSPTRRDSVLGAYLAGAVPHGAPRIPVFADGSLGIPGDQMTWCVYNDADSTLHNAIPGHTRPLDIEIRQTTFAYDAAGPLGGTVFMLHRLFNRGSQSLHGLIFGLWTDPDLGGFSDDYVGYDGARGMGFAYNATNADAVYGAAPPALGIDILRGPTGPGGIPRTANAFVKYINGTDPSNATQTFNYMRGLAPDGSLIVDPVTSQVTPFAVPGDPVAGTGWLDSNASDRRMMLCAGPFDMAPGDSQSVLTAVIVAQGANRLASITALRFADDVVQQFADLGLVGVSPGGAAGSALRLAVGPNPSAGRFTLAFRLASDAPASLEAFDMAGRRVREQSLEGSGLGPRSTSMDLGDEPAGLYFVRLRQGTRAATARVLLVR